MHIPLSLAERRFLRQASEASDEECECAFEASGSELMAALRTLRPGYVGSNHHDVYHLGPYRRVEAPDKDLPRRDSASVPNDEYLSVKNMSGQRCIPPFRDSNELGDILGGLYVASTYPEWEDRERFEGQTIQGALLMASDRIRDKLRRNKNPQREELFQTALLAVRAAADCYFNSKHEAGSELVWKAVHALQDGNRRRKRGA